MSDPDPLIKSMYIDTNTAATNNATGMKYINLYSCVISHEMRAFTDISH